MKRPLAALALVAACASRQPDPPRQIVWTHAPEPTADAGAPASAPEIAAPAPRAIEPVLPALALENLRFRDVVECARGECRVDPAAPRGPASVTTEGGATLRPPAMAWVQVIRPGASVVIPRSDAFDLLGVALVGELALERAGSRDRDVAAARPWTAFMLPDCGAVLRAGRAAPAAALLVTARGDAGAPREHAYATRDLAAVDDLAWAGGAMHARIAFEAPGSPRASLGLLFASDDAPVAEHAHPESWEVLAALSAAGRLHLPAGAAAPARDRTVTDGTIAYVPAAQRHAWMPDGTHPLIAVQVYSPPGPEQRFRALARGATAPTPPNGTPAP